MAHARPLITMLDESDEIPPPRQQDETLSFLIHGRDLWKETDTSFLPSIKDDLPKPKTAIVPQPSQPDKQLSTEITSKKVKEPEKKSVVLVQPKKEELPEQKDSPAPHILVIHYLQFLHGRESKELRKIHNNPNFKAILNEASKNKKLVLELYHSTISSQLAFPFSYLIDNSSFKDALSNIIRLNNAGIDLFYLAERSLTCHSGENMREFILQFETIQEALKSADRKDQLRLAQKLLKIDCSQNILQSVCELLGVEIFNDAINGSENEKLSSKKRIKNNTVKLLANNPTLLLQKRKAEISTAAVEAAASATEASSLAAESSPVVYPSSPTNRFGVFASSYNRNKRVKNSLKNDACTPKMEY